ncbi:hypothetical protein ACHAQH_002593 [Verticillium albo-atrum]
MDASKASLNLAPATTTPQSGPLTSPAMSSTVVKEAAGPSSGVADCTPEFSILNDIATRVDIKEKAIRFALDQLKPIRLMLSKFDPHDIREIADWPEASASLEKSALKREWFVGLTGDTGAGKSTATNAVLGFDISPTNSSDACTAAPCVYSYNYSKDPKEVFCATITFKSTESVRNDLDLLQEELSDIAHNIKEQNYHPDAETVSRQNQSRKQLKIVQNWSGLTENDIEHLPSSKIISLVKKTVPCLNMPSSCDSHTEKVYDSDFKRFRKNLKPYIDSSGRSRGAKQHWALVQQVEILLKSDVLRHGIKIVDLPGVADSLESRAAVARDFLERLDKLLVVVHAVRAADNKTGSDAMLMPATLSMDMGLEGKFEPDSLAVIVTKIDDINTRNAENDFPDDNDVLKSCNTWQTEKDQLVALEEDIVVLRDSMDEREMASPQQDDEQASTTDDSDSPKKRGRTSIAILKTGNDDFSRLASMKRERDIKKENIHNLASELKRCCIQARNRRVKEAVGQNLADIKAQVNPTAPSEVGEFESSVLPISATAFIDINGGDSVFGFAHADATGVPALKDWLTRAHLPKRDIEANDDILNARALFDALDSWTLKESVPHLRISTEEEEEIKDLLGKKIDDLTQLLKNFQKTLSARLGRLNPLRATTIACPTRIRHGDEAPTIRALEGSKRAQEKWVIKRPSAHVSHAEKYQKLSHMTYKACVRRNGREWTTSTKPRITYNWMAAVQLNFWRAHGRYWHDTFFQRLPTVTKLAKSNITDKFNDFIANLLAEEKFPEEFRTGMFKCQQAVINQHFEQAIHPMLAEARNLIESELMAHKKQRITELQQLITGPQGKPGKCAKDLKHALTKVLRDACEPASKATSKTQSKELRKAKEATSVALDKWRQYWQPIDEALPKQERSNVFDDTEDEEGDEDESSDKGSIAGKPQAKAIPKARAAPKATAAPKAKDPSKTKTAPKTKRAPRPQPKNSTAKAQRKSAPKIKLEKDCNLDGSNVTADNTPPTNNLVTITQQIGAMMAEVVKGTEASPEKTQGEEKNQGEKTQGPSNQ